MRHSPSRPILFGLSYGVLAEVTGFGRASAVVMSATTFAGVAAALVALRLRAHVIVAMVVAATATALVRVAF